MRLDGEHSGVNVDKMEQDGPGLLPSSSELLEQYRSIFESSLDAILIANLDGVIVEVNPAACDMYGYTYAEFIGMDAATIMHSTSRSVIAENLRMVVDRGSRHLSGLGMHKDGSPFNVEARISLFSYLGKPHALAVVRDITERVHAYELLEK